MREYLKGPNDQQAHVQESFCLINSGQWPAQLATLSQTSAVTAAVMVTQMSRWQIWGGTAIHRKSFKIMRGWNGGSSPGLAVTTSDTSVDAAGRRISAGAGSAHLVWDEAALMETVQEKGQGRWWKRWNERGLLARKRQRIKTRQRRLRSLTPPSTILSILPSHTFLTHTHTHIPHPIDICQLSDMLTWSCSPLSVTVDGQLTGPFIQHHQSWRWGWKKRNLHKFRLPQIPLQNLPLSSDLVAQSCDKWFYLNKWS